MKTARSIADASWLRGGVVPRLLAMLDRDGEEARVVGGAVRNELLGAPVNEVDIATTATPDVVIARVKQAGFKPVPTGIDHGTVTVVIDGAPLEVTTLRRDVETDGRHAKVAFGRDWNEDAQRRDFTINALSATRDGAVYDYTGGLADLEARRVRFIGDPRARIAEDYLRILRFFRFHAAYGQGGADAQGLAACIAGRAGLDTLSRERLRMEILKLVVAPGALTTVIAMADAGLLTRVLGGVVYPGVFARMLALMPPPDAVERLGALAVAVAEDAGRLGERLRLTRVEQARLAAIGTHWPSLSATMGEAAARVALYRLKVPAFTDAVRLASVRAGGEQGTAWDALIALPLRWPVPVFPLKAADFIARGFDKGPALGAVLRKAEEAWIVAGFPDDADVLRMIADKAAELKV